MNSVMEISPEMVSELNEKQLPKLLRKLLYVEATVHNIPLSTVSVSHDIYIPDDGEDGRIEWENGPENTDWIPCRFAMFQIKATKLTPAKCRKEVLEKNEEKLKDSVEEVIRKNGAYILIENKSNIIKKGKKERIEAIRNAVKEVGNDYANNIKIDIYDKSKLAEWINTYEQVVYFFWQEFKFSTLLDFFSWETLIARKEKENRSGFISNEVTYQIIKKIKENAHKQNGILRLVGLPGLGKTRILIEAVSSDYILQNIILYIDAKNFKNDLDILSKIRQITLNGRRCFLVIDNCNLQTHKAVQEEIYNSPISFLTLFHNPDEDIAETTLKIDPNSFSDLIEKLVGELFPNLLPQDVNKIVEFAQGFPLIAVLLSEGLNKKNTTIGVLNDRDLLKRLLGIDEKEEEVWSILRACAIFSHFGYEDNFVSQRDFIATHKRICKIDCKDEDTAKDKFYECVERFIRRGIIEKAGRKVFVKPKPLALRLAADWWENCRPEIIHDLLDEISKAGLANELCDQVAKLDFLPKAKDITRNLCGVQGPFGNAKALNTEEGSRIFRSLVEVNPQATVDALERIFSPMSKEELTRIDKGRRNLVWALEKLCFRAETFEKATKILLLFAIAENETWISNNATGQFLQLFQAFLPGTQANYDARMSIIEYALSKDDKDYEELAFSALSRGVKARDFYRTGGAESQGSGAPLQDYPPKEETFKVLDYWRYCINKLMEYATSENEFSIRARERLINSIRSFSSRRAAHLILPAIEKLLTKKCDDWVELRRNLNLTLKYESLYLNENEVKQINELITKLDPNDFQSLYISFVKSPSLDDLDIEEGYSKAIRKKVFALAEKFVSEGYQIGDYIDLFLKGEQEQGFYFGEVLGELFRGQSDSDTFFELSISTLKKIKKEHRNPLVLAGFIYGQKEASVKLRYIKRIFSDPDLKEYSFSIASLINPEIKILNDLFKLVEDNIFSINEFLRFQYGRALDHLPSSQLIEINKKIANFNLDGARVAISILYMYCYNNDKNWKKVKDTILEILLKKDILLSNDRSLLDEHKWGDLWKRFLKEENNPQLAKHLINEIINLCSSDIFLRSSDYELKNVLRVLISEHFDTVWPDLKDALLSEDESFITFFNLKALLGSKISSIGLEKGALFYGDLEKIFAWCQENKEIAPRRVIGMAPIFNEKINGEWHPFTKQLIDEFGDTNKFVDELSAKMGTYSWVGSVVPYLKNKKKLIEELKNHHFIEVREWANTMSDYLDKEIHKERNEDIERFL